MSRMVCIVMLALAGGIVAAHRFRGDMLAYGDWQQWQMYTVAVVCALAAVTAVAYVVLRRHFKAAGYVLSSLTVLFWFAVGVSRYTFYTAGHSLPPLPREGTLRGIVASQPVCHDRYTTIVLRIPDSRLAVRVNLWADADSSRSDTLPALGDLMAARVRWGRQSYDFGNPDEFDYASWLWTQGISGTCHVIRHCYAVRPATADELSALSLTDRLRIKALQLRQRLLARFASTGLDAQALAIVSAMTLADRSHITPATRDLYSEAGASHLLAMSGLHLGIIVGLLIIVITRLAVHPLPRTVLTLLALVLMWGLAFITGLPTSLVRAGTMYSFLLLAMMLGRNSKVTDYLILTVTAMLLVSPTYLFDLSAQLSVGAVAGINCLHGPLRRYVGAKIEYRWSDIKHVTHKWYFKPIDGILLAFSAQVFTLPLIAVTFNRIPLYGTLLSVLLIPVTAVTIYLALALLAIGAAWPLGAALAWCVNRLVAFQIIVMQFVVSLPCAVVSDFWSEKARPQVVVYNNRRCPAFHLIASPSESWLLMPHPEAADSGLAYIASTFWAKRLTAKPNVIRRGHTLGSRELQVVMLCEPVVPRHTEARPRQVTFLWLCGDFNGSLTDIVKVLRPRLVILDASLQRNIRYKLRRETVLLRQPAYDIAESGAFRADLPLDK